MSYSTLATILGTAAIGLARRHSGSSIRLKKRNVVLIDHNVIFEVSEWDRNIDLDAVSDSINKKLLEVSFKEMDEFYIWQQIYIDWYDQYHIDVDEGYEPGSPITYKGGYIKTFISNKNGLLQNPIDNFIPTGIERFYPKENVFLDKIYGEYLNMIIEVLDGSIVEWHESGDGFYTHVEYGVLLKEDGSPYFRKSSTMPELRKR